MTRLEELARAVEDGSAREGDVKELARLARAAVELGRARLGGIS